MTTGASYQSDEELLKRLQVVLRDYADAGNDGSLGGESVREVRTIAAALAARIYDDPQKWGIADIREDFRDDAAADTLSKLLSGAAEFTGRQTVSEWFSREVESRFHRLWSMAERARGGERGQRSGAGPSSEGGETIAASVFEENSETWQGFEAEFPHDAFVLRLRHILRRSLEEIAVMLDAPNAQAIAVRINRSRDRFRMFCEQGGFGRREVVGIMAGIAEEQEQ